MSLKMKPSLTHPSATGKCHAPALSNAYHPSRGIGRSTIWAVSLLYSFMLIASLASAASITVSSDLQAAINAAQPGDTLLVAPGTYEKISIGKSLNLIGNGAVIQAGERDACVNIEASDVSISGFLVRNGFYGIKLNNVRGCTVANNTVIRCTQPGIALLFSDGNIIQGNNASFNGLGGEGWYGIYLSNSNDNLILDNVAYGNGAYGINLFPSCSNNTIRGNVLQGNMYGLYMFTDCSNNIIEYNDLSRNTNSGLDLRFDCTDNLIRNNSMIENVVAGLTLLDSGYNSISGNLIEANGRYGLQIQSNSNGNTIMDNSVSNSQTGIFLDSSQNLIYRNKISYNVIQAEDRGENSWNASYPLGGNLWSDYHGSDDYQGPEQNVLGADGFGDLPYEIDSSSLDRYPIMGDQVRQISIIDKALNPTQARVGDDIKVTVRMEALYDLNQLTVRAYQSGEEAKGYGRLVASGDAYQGSFSTALLDPGEYDLVLRVNDVRGFELEETLGSFSVTPRS